ncbi:MAG: hypothetical protein E6R14_00060 [Thermomicrobiales bacterium]|nr:MAG: hypothetical protein E6R14_00060 [Thermomicrobiales bacterium]
MSVLLDVVLGEVGDDREEVFRSLIDELDGRCAETQAHQSSTDAHENGWSAGGICGTLAELPTTKAAHLSRISCVRALHKDLIRSLLRVRQGDGLFVSNKGDSRSSPTVSAVAALALTETEEGLSAAQDTIKKLLKARGRQGPAKGAWSPQSGDVRHVLATAWPLFAATRILPNEVAALKSTICWLTTAARTRNSAWGWHDKTPPRPFPTAFALNALLAVKACEQHGNLEPNVTAKIDEAIRAGVDHLLETANRPDSTLIYWPDRSRSQKRICLATTSICYHVLHKHIALDRGRTVEPQLSEAISTTFAAMCQGLGAKGLDALEFEVPLPLGNVRASTWPVIHVTDGINYTFAFFTPLLATTLVELFKDIQNSPYAPQLRAACVQMVDWILAQRQHLLDSDGFLNVPGQAPAVWATAQGAIVLGRVTKVAELLL